MNMIVMSSGKLAGTSSKSIMILNLPRGMAGQTETLMSDGKPVPVLTSGAASQMRGKAVQLLSSGG